MIVHTVLITVLPVPLVLYLLVYVILCVVPGDVGGVVVECLPSLDFPLDKGLALSVAVAVPLFVLLCLQLMSCRGCSGWSGWEWSPDLSPAGDRVGVHGERGGVLE